MDKKFRPGDVVRIVSRTSSYRGDLAFVLGYCKRGRSDVLTVRTLNGCTVNIKESSAEEAKVLRQILNLDKCINFARTNGTYIWGYDRRALEYLIRGDVYCDFYGADSRLVRKAFGEYLAYVYGNIEEEPLITFSWEDVMGFDRAPREAFVI